MRGEEGKEERTDRRCPELTQQAVDRWMDGQTDEESRRVGVAEKAGASPGRAWERPGHLHVHMGIHTQAHAQ